MIGDGDVENLLALDDFAVPAVFTLAGGGTVPTRGIFTDATEETDMMSGKIETVDPKIDCETAAISTVKRGDTVLIDAVTYIVERIQRLGTGFTTVHLKT